MKFVGNAVPSIPTALVPSGMGDLVDGQYVQDRTPTTAARTTDYTNNTNTATTVIETRSLLAGTYVVECGWLLKCATITPTMLLSFGSTGGTISGLTGLWIWYTADTASRQGGAFAGVASEQNAIALSTGYRPATFYGTFTLSVAGTIAAKSRISAATTAPGATIQAGAWIRATPVL